ncbi:MAG: hypothetical protein ACI406_09415 [Victivallis vadensis]
MYTDDEIFQKRLTAYVAGLSGAELLNDTEAVRRDCNGIGAAWFPAWLRWTISLLCPSLVVVADIHDRRYSIGGTEEDRQDADREFEQNGERMADYCYARWNPLRRVVRNRARAMYAALVVGGKTAFNYHGECDGNDT